MLKVTCSTRGWIRQSAWVDSRYQRRESGQTAFQELKGEAYTSDVVPFGETVAGHFPQKHRKKMESDWHLGRTNEQLQREHSAHPRRSTPLQAGSTERYNKKIMENATGLPWDQRPPRDHADGGPFEGREPPRGTPGQSDEQLADRRPGAELAQFHASCGQTPGCQAWLGIRRGFHHTVACKARRQEWQDRRESEETETSGQGPQNQRRSQEPCRRTTYILPQR